ncbi:MAG: PEP-CTERM system TPR-repeat protein PrsT [Gammaproteobacteria bacterium]|nr:PEP-CTERM system TPR-repeat protein PrsT [Gammaproteobacteria bacterium]
MNTDTALRSRLIGLLAALLLPGGLLAADPVAVRYYEDAVARFNNGDAKGAEIQLKNALSRDPGQLAARILMGRIQLELGNALQAEEELVLANQLGADRTATALPLARARNRLGKYELNIEQLIPTEIPIDAQADVWVELGIARLKSGDPDGARIAFQQAVTIEPLHAGGMIGKAQVALDAGEFATAERLAGDAVEHNPDSSGAWFAKASALHAQGRHAQAAQAYARASDLAPGNTAAALGEATALLDGGDAAKASALLAAMRKDYPWMAEAPFLHAKALRELGKPDDAQRALEAAGEILDPVPVSDLRDNPALLRLAGILAAQNQRMERAYQAISLYLQQRPGDLQTRKLFARIALAMGKPADVKRSLVPLITAGRADAELLGLLGDASAQAHDFIAAESYYREALANHRGGPALIGRLGALQYRQGQRERALDTLQIVTEQEPSGATLGVSLYTAVLHLAEGRIDRARDITEQILAGQPDNLVALNLRAAVAITSGDRDSGRQQLEALLAKAPEFRPAKYNLAKLHALDGRYREAEAILHGFLTENANDQRALLELGRLATLRNDSRTAIGFYEKIRELDPKALIATTELIDLYLAESRPADAMKTALDLNSVRLDDFHAHATLAAVQVIREEYQDARSTLGRAVLLAGYDSRKLLRAATLQYAAQAHDDAVATLDRLLKEQPDALAARRLLGEVLFTQGKLSQARKQVEAVLERRPDDLYALAMLGDIQMAERQPAAAVATYTRAIAIDAQPELLVSAFHARNRTGQGDAALAELEAWQDANPDTAVVLRALAEHLHQRGRAEQAHGYYRRLIALTPDDARSLNNMANLLMDIDAEQAFRAARQALELDGDNPAILDTMGWALVQIGDLEKGIAHLRDAVARNGRSATTRYHLGAALEEYGSRIEARRQLQLALRLGTDSAPWAEDARLRLQRLN